MTMKLVLLVLSVVLVINSVQANICSNPSSYAGRLLCDHSGGYCGECVSFYKICSGDRRVTGAWIQGRKVRGNSIPIGAGIATFPGGKYKGHTAIYMGQNSQGIQVWDQWKNHPVSTRTIRWNGNGISNNGDSFYLIEGGSMSAAPSRPAPPSQQPSTPRPPASSFGTCTVNGVRGNCIDTNARTCSGRLWTGYCPGSSAIRCCTTSNTAIADEFSDVDAELDRAIAESNSQQTQTEQANQESMGPIIAVTAIGVIFIVVLVVAIVLIQKKLNKAQVETY